VLIALFFSIYNLNSYLFLNKDLARTSTEIARLNHEITLVKQKIGEQNKVWQDDKGAGNAEYYEKKVGAINSILERRGFLWSEFLLSLENVAPDGVSITRIEPSYGDKKIRISGLAKGFDQVSSLIDNLGSSAYIKKSFLLKESAVMIDKKFPALSFDIESEGTFYILNRTRLCGSFILGYKVH